MKPKISACATVQRHVDSIPLCEALDYVGLIFLFRIDTASVTALTQISASMVVPSSPTYTELDETTVASEEGFGPEQTRLALAGEHQGSFGRG